MVLHDPVVFLGVLALCPMSGKEIVAIQCFSYLFIRGKWETENSFFHCGEIALAHWKIPNRFYAKM
jgi:hypothetical protein